MKDNIRHKIRNMCLFLLVSVAAYVASVAWQWFHHPLFANSFSFPENRIYMPRWDQDELSAIEVGNNYVFSDYSRNMILVASGSELLRDGSPVPLRRGLSCIFETNDGSRAEIEVHTNAAFVYELGSKKIRLQQLSAGDAERRFKDLLRLDSEQSRKNYLEFLDWSGKGVERERGREGSVSTL